ncbi:type II secretion system F family protein [Candidatus Woesearchaeota archaeon]|nr:type II secretion system F family protein [Candidatus Woesearchaeota archaeon]
MAQIESILTRKLHGLKKTLRMAHSKQTPEQYVKKTVRLTMYAALALTASAFFLTAKMLPMEKVIVLILAVFTCSPLLIFFFLISAPKGTIKKRQREIDKDVLFAGRYILMKLESGAPIVNTLADASKGYGIAAKYFKEIVDEINTGVPVEDALESARTYSSSDKFRKVLWQLVVTLKTGTNVTGPLKATLASIANEQVIEIKEYGKKLNSLMLFYMVVACVAPSLGLAMFLIIGSFISLEISNSVLFMILFFLAVVQGFFLLLIKAARPMVEL